MAKVIVDLSEGKEFDRTPLPAGVYKATVDASYAQEIKIGKTKGTPYVTLGFVIDEPEEYVGRVAFTNYMLSGPGTGATKQLFKALGLYSKELGDTFQFDTNRLHGHAVTIRVKMRALDDGTEVNDISLVMSA